MKNTIFYQEVNSYPIEEAIDLAKDSHIPWAHRLVTEIQALRTRVILESEAAVNPYYYEDFQ